ncbi:MAG: uracil-DNA glycosylase family protein [Chloroflexota bacterium]
MSRIFINYRRQDSEGYVGRLYDHLTKHFERADIFMDIDNIKPGADFVETLESAVASCDVMITMIGPQWLTITNDAGSRRLDQWDDFVRIEIASALKQSKLIIPVLVGHARMPSPTELPEDMIALARRNALELSHQRFSYDVDKLIQVIKDTVSGSASLKITSPTTKINADSEVVRQKELAIKVVRIVREKELALKAVRDDLMNATTSPLYEFRTQIRAFPVLGEGNADANIIFIGEAPGKNETETGRPFIGPSGEVLDEMLRSIDLKREDVYVTNILMDRAPEKRDPTPAEIAFYAPFLDRIIDIIQPTVIATLGRFSMQYILKKLDLPEKRGSITQNHGKLIKTQAHYGEVHIVPLFHPAVVLYSASQKETLRKDFEKLKVFI